MNSGIYIIINKKNGNRYVGSAVNLSARESHHLHHLHKGKHCNEHLQRAWNKYGESAFEFEVLERWEPEFLVSMEQWWMNILAPEYNIVPVAGSSLGSTRSDEAIAKLSVAAKRRSSTKEGRAHLIAAGRRRGELTQKHGTGIFGLTPEQQSINSKLGYENSLGKMTEAQRKENYKNSLGKLTTEERSENGKRGVAKLRRLGLGVFGRTPEQHRNHGLSIRKLTRLQVHDIRHLLALGDMSQKEIAEHFPVSIGVISNINTGKAYADW